MFKKNVLELWFFQSDILIRESGKAILIYKNQIQVHGYHKYQKWHFCDIKCQMQRCSVHKQYGRKFLLTSDKKLPFLDDKLLNRRYFWSWEIKCFLLMYNIGESVNIEVIQPITLIFRSQKILKFKIKSTLKSQISHKSKHLPYWYNCQAILKQIFNGRVKQHVISDMGQKCQRSPDWS